jgi:putative membrane-bound dehydrogenase-like protein
MRLSFLIAHLAASPLFAQGFSPDEAIKKMQLPEGFKATAVATEPMIRQPLSISFDEKGRMWVLQYLQYPNPAGLKPVKQDQYLRTVWDRVPEPPPKGPKGLDRITICYDPDADGKFTKSKDFVTGLNLATGFCIGNGGVYVVQPPYLLFYPDKDHDDVPDGDPEVCVSGFGMEDTHSYANSLQWGPDGWLYGAHGSTVTAKIKNPANPKEELEFQQGIWRYHPKTKQFELFAEGGGNTYGLDFDKYGRCIAGTNWGGFAMLHHVQGAYYVKGFSKHGPLHNPHTYGYFDHVPYKNFKGGHVTCGGIVYQADAYPKEFHDQYIAGNLLSNAIYWHKMTEKGSSFVAEHGGDLLISNDTWFRPVDCYLGPDGSVYIADWYDKRAAHLDPIDNWDKTNGRIYRIDYVGKGDDKGERRPVRATMKDFDLRKKTSAELVELLKHPNKWWRNEARRLLAERAQIRAELAMWLNHPNEIWRAAAAREIKDETSLKVVGTLRKQVLDETGLLAMESLWALHEWDGLDDETALRLLSHPNEHVRAWVVRFEGDRFDAERSKRTEPSVQILRKLQDLAGADTSPLVRSQLACTAKRIEGTSCLNIAFELAKRSEDQLDPHLPMLGWWAIEHELTRLGLEKLWYFQRNEIVMRFWQSNQNSTFLAERIARRIAALDLVGVKRTEKRYENYQSTVMFVASLPKSLQPAAIRGVELAFDGQTFSETPVPMALLFEKSPQSSGEDDNLFRLRVRFNHGDALKEAHARLADSKRPDADKVKLIQLLGQVRRAESLPVLMDIFRNAKAQSVSAAALTAAQSFGDPKVIDELAATFPKLTGALRQQVLGILLSRPATTLTILHDVDAKKLDPKSIPVEQLRPVLDFKNEEIDKLVVKHWGKIGAATPGEKQARITWLNAELGRGQGYAASGKELFKKNCAVCHTLFGEGGKVGPDLTTADRKNRGYLLTHIVDPSLYVRPEFMTYVVTTLDNRRLTGLVTESSEASVTLSNVIENKVVKNTISKKDIEEMFPSAISVMPEKMLDTLSYQEIRDLFAYLQTQVVEGPKEKSPPGKEPAKKDDAKKLKVLLISGSVEYKSDDTLPIFQKHLEANYPVECVRAFRKTDEDLPGLEALETCDVAVFFTRRLKITGDQLERVKKYATSGKPIVAIRTASHGFQNWLDMDKEVLGGDYKGHFGHDQKCDLKLTEVGGNHDVLKGVKPFEATGGLYKNPAVNKDVSVLMTGEFGKEKEPVSWVRDYKGGRVFYTSLGHPKDFENENFIRMLTNAVFWTAKKEVPAK